eukprot:8004195-Alexandrium_andersonii.AAC.1
MPIPEAPRCALAPAAPVTEALRAESGGSYGLPLLRTRSVELDPERPLSSEEQHSGSGHAASWPRKFCN